MTRRLESWERINIFNPNRPCKICGAPVHFKRTVGGKEPGLIYRVLLCDPCLKKYYKEKADRVLHTPEIYNRNRKHFSRKCRMCGNEFDVRGLNNSDSKAFCSASCLSKYRANHMVSTFRELGIDSASVDKNWVKMFCRIQTAELTKMGPTNFGSSRVTLISPDDVIYKIINVVHFVRENGNLFNEDDVKWKPRQYGKCKCNPGATSTAKGTLRCRASQGLHSVSCGRKKSWKGWRKI